MFEVFSSKQNEEPKPLMPETEKPPVSLDSFKDEADQYVIKILRENNFDDERILNLMLELEANLALEKIKYIDIEEQLVEQEKALSSDAGGSYESEAAREKAGKLKQFFKIMTVLAGITIGSLVAEKTAVAGGSSSSWERYAQRWADIFMRDTARMPGKMFDDSRRKDFMGIDRSYQAQREITMEIRRIYDSYRRQIQSDPGNAAFWEEKRDKEVKDMLILKGIINQDQAR
jgi:hypothetical protein